MNGGSPGEDAISDVNISTIVTMPTTPVLRIIAVQRSETSLDKHGLHHRTPYAASTLEMTSEWAIRVTSVSVNQYPAGRLLSI